MAVTASTELLSLIKGIRPLPLAVLWTALVAGLAYVGDRRGTLAVGWNRLKDDLRRLERNEVVVAAGLSAVAVALLVVAWLAPPNNNDSMIYHMSRVMHWAQDGSLAHFPTQQHGQISKPFWTESAILTLRVLFGNDRPANLVQWSAMALSLVGVSAVAGRLGASWSGQWAAAAFAASVPLGVLHSTNTKNDYSVALWMVCLVYLVLVARRRPLGWVETVLVGAAVGLGLLTKGTAFPYIFPAVVWFAVVVVRSVGLRRALGQAAVIGIVAAGLNLGLWSRNLTTYGGLYGPPGGLAGSVETDELVEPEAAGGALIQAVVSRAGWLIVRVARTAGQNIVMPEIGGRLREGLYGVPALFDREYVDDLEEGLWNHEDTAGNLLHLTLFVLAGAVIAVWAVRRREGAALEYLAVVTAGFVGLALITASSDLFGVRYQLPFFILAAPIFGLALSTIGRPGLSLMAALLLILAAVPYVVLNNTRPLIGTRPRTRVGSVLTTPRVDLLFAHVPEQEEAYLAAAQAIRTSTCRSVGLEVPPSQLEYLIWWVLDAPQSGIRIENLSTSPYLDRYRDPAFQPCAVVCVRCTDKEWGGLPLWGTFDPFRLYGRPGPGP
jgi:4-amino-4-deoxy-L-arabinose transferase-like glycosyltransferase